LYSVADDAPAARTGLHLRRSTRPARRPTVTFVSGPYLVLVGFAAPPNAPSAADTKAILKSAQRRLTQGPS
jgi:hypothetical protein